jgi:DNA-binding response OmpR family regulator
VTLREAGFAEVLRGVSLTPGKLETMRNAFVTQFSFYRDEDAHSLAIEPMNILVIEDDKRIAGLVERGLKENGHQVVLSHDGWNGVERMLSGKYDAALLDIYLPRMDGFEVLEQVRARRCKTPVLVLTAVDAVPKILRAFDLGADDYLVKPFLLEILLARVGAITRRTQPAVEPQVVRAGGVVLDRSRGIAVCRGKEIYLTGKQVELLDVLMRRNGLITSREQLIEAGWGNLADVKENTLDVYIHGLRAKLDVRHEDSRTFIRTIHGTGYMFVADSE